MLENYELSTSVLQQCLFCPLNTIANTQLVTLNCLATKYHIVLQVKTFLVCSRFDLIAFCMAHRCWLKSMPYVAVMARIQARVSSKLAESPSVRSAAFDTRRWRRSLVYKRSPLWTMHDLRLSYLLVTIAGFHGLSPLFIHTSGLSLRGGRSLTPLLLS